MLLARDIMTRDAVTIHHSASLRDLSKLLVETGITGVPVIDEEKRLLGMVALLDLVSEQVRNLGAHPEYEDIYELFSSALNVEDAEEVSARHLWVDEIMSRTVFTASETTPVREICATMRAHNIRHVPILKDDRLVGIVTAMDIIRSVAEGRQI